MNILGRSEKAKADAKGRLDDALESFGDRSARSGVGPVAGLITLIVLAVIGLVVLL